MEALQHLVLEDLVELGYDERVVYSSYGYPAYPQFICIFLGATETY